MKRVALTLAAIGLLGVVADQAFAQRVLSHATGTHMAAGYGINRTGHASSMRHFQQMRHYRPGYGGQYGYRGYGGGPALIHPRMRHHPSVVIPFRGRPPVVHPRIYHRPSYYRPSYRGFPHRGFSYQGRGFSFGIRF